MKLASSFLLGATFCITFVASPPFSSADASQPSAVATLSGIVIKEPGSEPVKKAIIELIAEDQQQGGNYTAVTGADGSFRIEGITPGRYHLFAERTGYIESMNHGGSRGRTLTLAPGQYLKDIQVRFAAAAIVSGRVTDEDGDPLENAEVTVLRRTFSSGRGRFQQVGSERTNDLGEYRISGLAAGSYYLSVSPPPDFKSLIDSENSPAVGKNSASTNSEKPSTSYQTTYYPGTPDRSQSEPIQLRAGDEFPANFSLTSSPTLTIRGSVANLPPGSSALIMLQSNDFNVVFNGAEVHRDGSFVIRDVSPGAYTIIASVESASVSMVARQSLQVISNNIDGLRLVPQTGATVRGRLHWEGKTNGNPVNCGQTLLTLHPADGDDSLMDFSMGNGFSPVAQIAMDGTFQWTNVPPGTYSLRLGDERNATNCFLKSVSAGGRAADMSAISVDGGVVELDVIASANAGIVEGIVTDSEGEPVPDAVIVAVPQAALRTRTDHFHKTISDQRGHFSLQGIAPGEYSVFAWDNLDGDSYYDPDFLQDYEPRAIPLRIVEGDRKNLQVQVVVTEEQP
jgi:protocatechuate 3,4-dioxygenase beta subunit